MIVEPGIAAATPRVPLRELGTWTGGGTPSKGKPEYWRGHIPWVSPKDMKVLRIVDTEDHISEGAVRESATNVVPAGAILMVTRSGILSRTFPVAVADVPVALNQDLRALTPRPGVDSAYVYWALQAIERDILDTCTKDGTTVASIDTGKLLRTQIPLPSHGEQRAIVAVIEEQLSRLEVATAQVASIRKRALRYRDIVRQLALRGSLRTDTALTTLPPEGWRLVPISSLATVTSGATPKAGDPRYYVGGSVPWVTSGDLSGSLVRAARQLITDAAVTDYRLKLYPAGTLLVAMYGEGKTRGTCAELTFPATSNQACAAVIVKGENVVLTAWLKLFFQASYEANRRLASGGVQPNLSAQRIKSMTVPLPPTDVQGDLVAQVDRQASGAEHLLEACELARKRSGALRRGILAAVFTGGVANSSRGGHSPDAWNTKFPDSLAALR